MFDNIKRYVADDSVFYGLLILFIGITSFGLGRWSVDDSVAANQPASIVFSDTSNFTIIDDSKNKPKPKQTADTGQFVGSVNSDKYHLPYCSGAKRIKESNRVWFASKADAAAAGYTPAGNCPGL